MQVTDARKMNAAEIAALMKKKAFDEVELSPRIQAGTDAMSVSYTHLRAHET